MQHVKEDEGVYLSVLIPARDQTPLLGKLMGTIFTPENSGLPFEVIVCDDGSLAPIQLDPGVNVIRRATSRGAAAARNTAASQARGEALLFLDADTLLAPGSLAHTITRFQTDPALVAINGGAHPDAANPESGFTAQYRAFIDHVQQNLRAPEECSFFTTRCGAIRRDAFFANGGFNEDFTNATVEDYEFGHRLVRVAPIRFDSKLSAQHHYGSFQATAKNYFVRVRAWASLFTRRQRFDNYGSATRAAGIGSALSLLWVPALLLPSPARELGVAVSLLAFFYGYGDIFYWSLRLKGPMFCLKSILLTWILCWVIVPAAALGMLQGIIP